MLEALGKSLIPDVVHEDSHEVVENLLVEALKGNFSFSFCLRPFNFNILYSYITYSIPLNRSYVIFRLLIKIALLKSNLHDRIEK